VRGPIWRRQPYQNSGTHAAGSSSDPAATAWRALFSCTGFSNAPDRGEAAIDLRGHACSDLGDDGAPRERRRRPRGRCSGDGVPGQERAAERLGAGHGLASASAAALRRTRASGTAAPLFDPRNPARGQPWGQRASGRRITDALGGHVPNSLQQRPVPGSLCSGLSRVPRTPIASSFASRATLRACL
jgi:hypothetical protein